jgi:hypothetical protein
MGAHFRPRPGRRRGREAATGSHCDHQSYRGTRYLQAAAPTVPVNAGPGHRHRDRDVYGAIIGLGLD